jgi:hypothetical protein
LGDVNFPMTDYTDNLGDYEDDGFYNPELDDMDFLGYTTTYTKERKFEIIILKLCTKMETPLYAFEEIMKWAREALWYSSSCCGGWMAWLTTRMH